MVRLRGVLALVLTVVAAAAGLGAWLLLHHGYPDVVYYERVTITGSVAPAGPQQAELWVDPARGRELRLNRSGPDQWRSLITDQGRHEYSLRDGVSYDNATLPDDVVRALLADWQQLGRDGFRGLAAYRLAHAIGPMRHIRLDGRDALFFETDRHDHQVEHLLVWLDARTHEPLQLEVQNYAYTLIQRMVGTRRLPAGSLPADFFDLPRLHDSYWDRTISWLRHALGVRR